MLDNTTLPNPKNCFYCEHEQSMRRAGVMLTWVSGEGKLEELHLTHSTQSSKLYPGSGTRSII